MALSRLPVERAMVNFCRPWVSASAQVSQALISTSISSRRNGSTGASSATRGRGTFFIGLGISNSVLAQVKKADRPTWKL